MHLIDCEPHDLTGSVFEGTPEVLTRRRVLYVPRPAGGADRDFGLFEESGRLILGSALFYTSPARLKTQSITTSIRADADRPRIARAIYGGAIGAHYGHFITECLNTLWYFMAHGGPDDHVLFHSDLTPERMFAIPWMAELLRHAGVRPEQILVPTAPTMIERLIVPGQAFSEDGFVYRAFAQSCGALGEAMLAGDGTTPGTDPVYLTRASIAAGTRTLLNEDALVAAFARRGIRSQAPETLSVSRQIALFSGGPVIGLMGSAFHTSILARRPRGVVLCSEPMPYRTFPLMDAAHDARFAYVRAVDQRDAPPTPGFAQAFSLPDPQGTADALLARVHAPRDPLPDIRAILPPGELRVWALHTHDGEPIVLDIGGERVAARKGSDAGRTLMLLLSIGDVGFLCAGAPDLPAMAIAHETMRAPVLSYRLGHVGAHATLRHPRTGRWLKAPPAHTMLDLHCDADSIRDWEKFRLAPAELRGAQGHLATLLEALRLAARGEHPEGAQRCGLPAAIGRLTP